MSSMYTANIAITDDDSKGKEWTSSVIIQLNGIHAPISSLTPEDHMAKIDRLQAKIDDLLANKVKGTKRSGILMSRSITAEDAKTFLETEGAKTALDAVYGEPSITWAPAQVTVHRTGIGASTHLLTNMVNYLSESQL